MSVFSKLFGVREKRVTERRFEEIAEETRRQMQPVNGISLGIVKIADAMRGAVKDLAEWDTLDKDSRLATECAVLYQSIYYVRAVTMQIAYRCLDDSQLDRFVSVLDPLLASTAISSYHQVSSEHFPQDLKDRLIRDYYECGEEAELEFIECTKANSEKHGKDRLAEMMSALENRTVRNISSIVGEIYGHHMSVYLTVMSATNRAMRSFGEEIIQAVANLKNIDLPQVDSNDLLRYLMTSNKQQR